MNRRAIAAAALALGAVLFAAWRWTRDPDGRAPQHQEREWRPLPRVVTVEVQNGGDQAGAARDAALRLRQARLDVVYWGNAPEALRDTATTRTRVLVRAGDTTGVGRIAEVLGPIDLIDRPDPRRLVDLTVVIPRRPREP